MFETAQHAEERYLIYKSRRYERKPAMESEDGDPVKYISWMTEKKIKENDKILLGNGREVFRLSEQCMIGLPIMLEEVNNLLAARDLSKIELQSQ